MANLKTFLIFQKPMSNQLSYQLHNLISPKPTWNSQRSLICKKKIFLRKSSKPGHGNLILINSTVQLELSKLNFNFDDIRMYFLQVLRDCDK